MPKWPSRILCKLREALVDTCIMSFGSGFDGSILVIMAVMGLVWLPLPVSKLKKVVLGSKQLSSSLSSATSRPISTLT